MNLSSTLAWLLPAVLVFWAVGAYNRLVRLRSTALQAFGALDAAYVQHTALVRHALSGDLQPDSPADPAWPQVHAAALQVDASLAVARARPLQRDAVAALGAAREVLDAAWAQALQGGGCDEADQPVSRPSDAQVASWDLATALQREARERYNAAARGYSRAVTQFPAVLLAQMFGFKPTCQL